MNRPGFSLLELLVSLSLFSAVTALLLGSFFQFEGVGSKLEQTTNLRQELRNLETLLREDLGSAVFLTRLAGAKAEQPNPSGILGTDLQEAGADRDRIDLQIHSRGKFFNGFKMAYNPELFEVSYYFDRDEQGVLGVYRRESFFVGRPLDSGGEAIVHRLSTRLKGFNLTYYDFENKSQPGWVSSTEAPLPSGVDVTLVLEGENGLTLEQKFTLNLHPSMGPGGTWGSP